MMKLYFSILFCLTLSLSFAQVNYNGNGGQGFGGVIGTGSLTIDDDGTTITFDVTRGMGDFNDATVFYIDSTPGGRNVIDANVNDQNDDLRRAISSAGANESVLTFPVGFEADYAIAVDVNFGGLWAIPAVGPVNNGELAFISSANSTLSATTDASYTVSVDWSQLGLTSTGSFKFIAVYLNAGNGFTSNEAFGSPMGTDNLGGDDFTFSSFFEYSNTLGLNDLDANTPQVLVESNVLNISNYSGNIEAIVFDITGKVVTTISDYSEANSASFPLNLQRNQIYLVNVQGSNFNKTLKVIMR